MAFFSSIKFRTSLFYLFLILLAILFFVAVSYVLLDRSLFFRSSQPFVLKGIQVQFDAAEARQQPAGEYRMLSSMGLYDDLLNKIRLSDSYPDSVSTPWGEITYDLKGLIPPDAKGGIEIWVYGRFSGAAPGAYDVLIASQSKNAWLGVMAAYRRVISTALPITLFLVGIVGFFWIRRTLRPVDEITSVARALNDRELDRRVKVQGRDELGKLGASLNEALGRLQGAFDSERKFVADASHELRAPLAVMQTEAQVALNKSRTKEEYEASLEAISTDITKMSALVHKLLTLSRAASGKEQLKMKEVSLRDLLTEVISDMQVLAEATGLTLTSNLQDDPTVNGDEMKLRELYLNLLDNAVKYTPAGGTVNMSLCAGEGTAEVSIKDTGIGIPAEHLPHIFERFYRVNPASQSENSTGLGLTICREIAMLHGGSITVESKVGEGSTFTVSVPLGGNTLVSIERRKATRHSEKLPAADNPA